MKTKRAFHTATLLNDGKVLVTGGVDANGTYLRSAELFDPTSGTFTFTRGSMTTARAYQTATLLINGTVLVVGGLDGNAALATAELFDPANGGSFTPTKGTMAAGRLLHTATLLDHGPALTNGKVLVVGGGTATTATAELFDPGSGSFTATGSLEFDRRAHTATLLNDGGVLVTGGGGPTSNPNYGSSASAEVFDPKGMFIPTTVDMATKRANHRAILLTDGTALVVGGFTVRACFPRNSCITYLAAAELFGSGVFNATGDMNTPRAYHTMTILKDGTVLVTGGYNGSGPLATAELYQ
jgi:hypothetical protein